MSLLERELLIMIDKIKVLIVNKWMGMRQRLNYNKIKFK